MKKMAEVLLTSIGYFALYDEDIIDPDTSTKALENFAYELSQCSDDEIKTLTEVAQEKFIEAKDSNVSDEWIDFYQNVIENLGLK